MAHSHHSAIARSGELASVVIDNTTTVRDRAWVARISTGDGAAFAAMFRAYKDDLGAFIESYVRTRAVAEELLQDLFLHIWDQRYSWQVPGPLNAYLFRAARNRAIGHLRRERLESSFRERLLQEHGDGLSSVSAITAVELLEAEDLESVIERAVKQLPNRCREVFILNRYHNLTYAEVADVLEISVKTVEAQMGRALVALRRRLASWHR